MFRPPYNQMLWRDTSILPPYFLTGNNLQIFPLRANATKLANFIDNYLNIVPKSIGHFQPAAPYVLLAVSSTADAAQHPSSGGIKYGFISQCNLMFSIPLLWFRQTGRKMELHDVVSTMPFVYTSDWSSLFIMRRVFGWSNVIGRFEPSLQPWQQEINSWNPVVTAKASALGVGWRSEEKEYLPILQIEQEPRSSLFQAPPIYGDKRGTPLDLLPRLANGTISSAFYLSKLLAWWAKLGLVRYPREVSKFLQRKTRTSMGSFNQGLSNGMLSLKQFRDAEKQDRACYQSLLHSQAILTQVDRFGLLGFNPLPFTDSAGGFRIRIYNYPSAPIMETLGLIPEGWEGTRSNNFSNTLESYGPVDETELRPMKRPRTVQIPLNKPPVAILKPFFPFFLSGSMTYSEGQTLCWRTRDSRWRAPFDEQWCTETGEQRTKHKDRGFCEIGGRFPEGTLFNNSAGPSILEFSGPFRFYNATIRYLPLKANRTKLQKLCDQYLNIDDRNYFEVWSDHVILTASNNWQTISLSENMEDWGKDSLSYAIPMIWYRIEGGERKFVSISHFVPFSYSNSETGTTIMNNIFGWSQAMADLDRPPDPWADIDGPDADRPLLNMWRDTNPSFRYPSFSERRIATEILQIHQESRRNQNDPDDDRDKNEKIKCILKGYKRTTDVLNRLGSNSENFISLKQIPDATAEEKAVYRALVCMITRTKKVTKRKLISDELEIRIHHNSLLPITYMLGLKSAHHEYGKSPRPTRAWQGDQVTVLYPDRPYWYRKTYQSGEAFNISSQSIGEKEWQYTGANAIRSKISKKSKDRADPQKVEELTQLISEFNRHGITYLDVMHYVMSEVYDRGKEDEEGPKWQDFRGWF